MYFEMEAEKKEMMQGSKYRKGGNHLFEKCKFQPICAIFGYDHPSNYRKDYVNQNSYDHSNKCVPLDYAYCMNYYGNYPAFYKNCKAFKEN